MASMASLSTKLTRSLLSMRKPSHLFMKFSTNFTSNNNDNEPHIDDPTIGGADNNRSSTSYTSSWSSPDSNQQKPIYQRPLENGLDNGVFRAILVGQVGQSAVQKRLKSGRLVTLFSLGTGGIRNNRRPLDNEEPREYAERCAVQWHRVSVYPERLGALALKHIKPGSLLYLEGNLETKVFSDPISGLVRRIREIAVRRDGRLVFLGNDGDEGKPSPMELKGVGYY
ncbi:hypothetical protein GIB67_036240 [Kingdonia uniflora]|uniref:Single-stranded DNA-binding protein n=1 Tax=Kingdonia uniflora TaxID=39325 RepID=A0A7J7NTE6_9MAGN|nr:hypothetical protein GIB67_036240 [Kingdonia uniflora]